MTLPEAEGGWSRRPTPPRSDAPRIRPSQAGRRPGSGEPAQGGPPSSFDPWTRASGTGQSPEPRPTASPEPRRTPAPERRPAPPPEPRRTPPPEAPTPAPEARPTPPPGPRPAPPQVAGDRRHGLTAESLTAETVVRRHRRVPAHGWRKAVFVATGGVVNPKDAAPDELEQRQLTARVRAPVDGCHRIGVISLKGGVGKTTTTAALGAVLASLRADRVLALDANPDRGTLHERVPGRPTATVRDLLTVRHEIRRHSDVRAFTTQAPSGLEVLASESDPTISTVFSESDYRTAVEVLKRYYSVLLTDCGTGLLHSAMKGVLDLAHQVVVVTTPSLDGGRSASATLDWLERHGYADLALRAVTVISGVRPGGGRINVDRLVQHFAARSRTVVQVPYDPYLEAGGSFDLDALGGETRTAYLRLAANVADGFTRAL